MPVVKILENSSSSDRLVKSKGNEFEVVVRKSLHQRKLDYEEARKRIFGEEITKSNKSRNFRKIEKMRTKQKNFRRIHNKIIATIVTVKGDNRFFARTKIDGQEVLALLDSGAGASCLGKNA